MGEERARSSHLTSSERWVVGNERGRRAYAVEVVLARVQDRVVAVCVRREVVGPPPDLAVRGNPALDPVSLVQRRVGGLRARVLLELGRVTC